MVARPDAHPTDALLRAYTLGKVDDSTAAWLTDHLEACSDCRSKAAEVSDDSFAGKLKVAHVDDVTPQPPDDAWKAALQDGKNPGASRTNAALPPGVPPELAGLPGYEIIKELGRGGMGVVYLARNALMDRYEVLKVMNKTLVGQPEAVERFLQEIRTAAQLSHPNVATAHSAHQVGDLLVLAMEYVDGDDLAKVVRERGAMPIPNACFCAHQVAIALQRGHELGMVHRDVKPSNILLSRQGKRPVVKVIDFGLAKAKSELRARRELTGTNQMMGTPGYSAPEQLNDAKTADIRSDIYALGCTLYFLLAGKPPFKGDSVYAVFLAQESGAALPLRELRPDVPEELAQAVASMIARNPAERFQQPRDAAAALVPFLKRPALPMQRDGGEELGRTVARETEVRKSSLTVAPDRIHRRPEIPSTGSKPDDFVDESNSQRGRHRKTNPSVASANRSDQHNGLKVEGTSVFTSTETRREHGSLQTPVNRKRDRVTWEDVNYCLDNIKSWVLIFAGATVLIDTMEAVLGVEFFKPSSLGALGMPVLIAAALGKVVSTTIQSYFLYLLFKCSYSPRSNLKSKAFLALTMTVIAACLSTLTEDVLVAVRINILPLQHLPLASLLASLVLGASNIAFLYYLRGVALAVHKPRLATAILVYIFVAPWLWVIWIASVVLSLVAVTGRSVPASPETLGLEGMPAAIRALLPIGTYVTFIWYMILFVRVRAAVNDHLRVG